MNIELDITAPTSGATSARRYTGAGRYEVETFGVRKIVWLEPGPEPARAYFDEDKWLQWSETEELRSERGKAWSRLDIVEPLIIRKVGGV